MPSTKAGVASVIVPASISDLISPMEHSSEGSSEPTSRHHMVNTISLDAEL